MAIIDDFFSEYEEAQRGYIGMLIQKFQEQLQVQLQEQKLLDQEKTLEEIYVFFNEQLDRLTKLADENRFDNDEYNRLCHLYDLVRDRFDLYSKIRWKLRIQIKNDLANLRK